MSSVTRMETQLIGTGVVSAELRAEAARQRLSGRELARRLDLTPVYVARRLSGQVEPSASDLASFAAVLQVPVGKFFGEHDA